MSSMFRALETYNYRVWASGAVVSSIGTWMQRVAQDWLVLTQLTHENATAVGVVLALQFGPQVLLLPLTGFAADHFNRRKLIMITQATSGLLALTLGLLTVTGNVQLWQIFVLACLLGVVTAFDSPARSTFVAELVNKEQLPNAVGLNSTTFQVGRFIGPAAAGVLIAAVGTGWVFIINAASFAAVLSSLFLIRVRDLNASARAERTRGSLVDGFRYVRDRPDLRTIMVMLFILGTFSMNFPIFLSTMSVTVFGAGAGAFGLLTSALATGSVAGALLAARRANPRITLIIASVAVFGGLLGLAAFMPVYVLFALVLVLVGAAAQTLMTSSNMTLQMTTEPEMRGRVIAIFMAVLLGGAPLGAPFIGWIANTFGARWSLAAGAASAAVATGVGLHYLVRYRRLRLRIGRTRIRFTLESPTNYAGLPAIRGSGAALTGVPHTHKME